MLLVKTTSAILRVVCPPIVMCLAADIWQGPERFFVVTTYQGAARVATDSQWVQARDAAHVLSGTG